MASSHADSNQVGGTKRFMHAVNSNGGRAMSMFDVSTVEPSEYRDFRVRCPDTFCACVQTYSLKSGRFERTKHAKTIHLRSPLEDRVDFSHKIFLLQKFLECERR